MQAKRLVEKSAPRAILAKQLRRIQPLLHCQMSDSDYNDKVICDEVTVVLDFFDNKREILVFDD